MLASARLRSEPPVYHAIRPRSGALVPARVRQRDAARHLLGHGGARRRAVTRRRPPKKTRLAWALLVLLPTATGGANTAASVAIPAPADQAQPLDRPGPEESLRDLAGVLTPAQQRGLRQRVQALQNDLDVSVFVLVLDTVPPAAAGQAPLAAFLQRFFVRLSDRHPLLESPDWNHGIVLALAPAQRRARVGFGPGWNDQIRRSAARLAATYGATDFRRGRYPAGIERVLEATGALVRGEALPSRPGLRGWQVVWLLAAAAGVLAVVGAWHAPTGRRLRPLARWVLTLPHRALDRAAGAPPPDRGRLYPPPAPGIIGASAPW